MVRRSFVERLDAPVSVRRPGRHLGLSWHTLGRDSAAELSDLTQRSVDGAHARAGIVDDVSALFVVGRHGDLIDVLGGYDTAGHLQAAAWVRATRPPAPVAVATMSALIAPTWRGRGIGRALLDWQDGRARQLLTEAGHDGPARLADYLADDEVDRRRLHAAGGFSPQRVHQVLTWTGATAAAVESPEPSSTAVRSWMADDTARCRKLHLDTLGDLGARLPLSETGWASLTEDLAAERSIVVVQPAPPGSGQADEDIGYGLALRESDGGVRVVLVAAQKGAESVVHDAVARTLAAMTRGGAESAMVDIDTHDDGQLAASWFAQGFAAVASRTLFSVEL